MTSRDPERVLHMVVHGAGASDTAKSGRYNLSEATFELDQDWTAWLTHCVWAWCHRHNLEVWTDAAMIATVHPTSVNVGGVESKQSAKSITVRIGLAALETTIQILFADLLITTKRLNLATKIHHNMPWQDEKKSKKSAEGAVTPPRRDPLWEGPKGHPFQLWHCTRANRQRCQKSTFFPM